MFPDEEQEEEVTETEQEIQNSSPSLHQNQKKMAGDLLKRLFVPSLMLTVSSLVLFSFSTHRGEKPVCFLNQYFYWITVCF